MLNKKAQSTMEYLIILSAITAAIILFATGTLRDRVSGIYTNVTTKSLGIAENITFGGNPTMVGPPPTEEPPTQ